MNVKVFSSLLVLLCCVGLAAANGCSQCVAPDATAMPFCHAVVNYSMTCIPSDATLNDLSKLDTAANRAYTSFLKKWFGGNAPKKCQDSVIEYSCYSFFTRCTSTTNHASSVCQAVCKQTELNCYLGGQLYCQYYPTDDCTPGP